MKHGKAVPSGIGRVHGDLVGRLQPLVDAGADNGVGHQSHVLLDTSHGLDGVGCLQAGDGGPLHGKHGEVTGQPVSGQQ